MSSVDERVVNMQFNNAQFEAGVKTTMTSLDSLNKSLEMKGATKGLADLNAAGKNVQLGHIAQSVDDIANRFKAMSVVAITALATIVHHAIAAGTSILRSLTIDPVKAGLAEYETNLNSIQTILANTQAAGVNLQQVNAALQELNLYADQTIYSFSQMARNIGTFTAAGVALKPAVAAIKGIANLAALSGSNADQASTAMYQLSQALSSGTVRLIDWISVVNAGMGGTVFQRALSQTAVVMGKLSKNAVTLSGDMKTVKINGESFRDSLQAGWLTTDVLTATLNQFTADMTDAQLAAQGFSKEQIISIQKQAATAKAAATEVKTMTQLLGALREAAGSGWAQTWQIIFGDFEEAKDLWSGVYDVVSGVLSASAEARNQILGDWKKLGGRTALIETIANTFKFLGQVLDPIRDAFKEMFPPITGQTLYNLTILLRNFTESLVVSSSTADKLRRTFAGVFAIFGIGWDIIKQVARVLFELFGMASEGGTSILNVTANIGDFLVALRKAINEGDGLIKFFDGVRNVLAIPVKLLATAADILSTLFAGFDAKAAASGVTGFVKQLGPLGTLADFIAYAWDKVLHTLDEVAGFFGPMAAKFVEWFHEISDAVGGVNFADLLDAINTGALVALVVVIRNSFGRGGVSGVLGELTSTLSAMQTALSATTLLQIAIAVGVLAVAISVLSKIDSEGLAKALSAMAIMFTQLLAALAIISQIPNNNVARVYVQAASLTVLAIAINILAVAVKSLSGLNWDELAKGLAGVVVLLAAVTASARFLPPSASLISTGIGMLVLAGAIKVLVGAVTDLAGLSWEELGKGVSAVGALLAELTLFSRFAAVNAVGVLGSVGIILIATAIKILASAVAELSVMSWESLGKGMAVLAVSLGLIGGALFLLSNAAPTAPLSAVAIAIVAASLLILASAIQSISGISWENVGKGMAVLAVSLTLITAALVILSDAAPHAILSAGAILIVAVAVQILASAMISLSTISWEGIGKGLVVLAVALAIIVVALNAMSGTLAGAAALFIVSNALLSLAAVMKILGSMSWGEIIKGLVALALAFTVLGIAAAVLQPVIPAMLGLGLAITLIGLGLALAGAGVFLFAAGLTALGAAGAVGTAAIVAILSAVIGLVPVLVKQVGIALLLLLDIIEEAAPQIVKVLVDIIILLLEGIDRLLPVLSAAILKLITIILDLLVAAIPKMVTAGYKILISVLEGIRDNIFRIYTVVGQIIENFLRGIGNALPGIIQAGVDLILAFIRGLTKAIDNNAEAMGKAGGDLAVAIIKGMVKGLSSGVGQVAEAAKNVAKNALGSAMKFLGIASPSKEFEKVGKFSALGMAVGLDNTAREVEMSARSVGEKAMLALIESLSGVPDILKSGALDLTPTITPVLDLSKVQQGSAQLDSILATKPMDVNTSYRTARAAGEAFQENQDIRAANDELDFPGDVTNYTQNNYSPKALTPAEIYRNTKNQLSVTKGGLPK